jgi:RNA polymerase sigma factor (sigma-70 family)
MTSDSQVQRVQGLLARHGKGENRARDELMALAFDDLERLARMMLRSYPGVHRWEGTDDILQGASLRLFKALGEVKPPTPADFFRLAATQIRRELIDLARRFSGPHGLGAQHETHHPALGSHIIDRVPDESADPAQLAEWSAFHQQAETLPEPLCTVFDLIYYQGLSQEEAAEALDTSVRTIRRQWQKARIALHDAMAGSFPGD